MVDIAVKTGAKVVAIVTIIRGGAEGGIARSVELTKETCNTCFFVDFHQL
jgi:hypothetical protein